MVYPESPTVVSFNSKFTFTSSVNNICLPITELILRATTHNLAHLKKIQYRVPISSVLLLSVLAMAYTLVIHALAADILKLLATNIVAHRTNITDDAS